MYQVSNPGLGQGIMEYWVQKVFVLISIFRIIPAFQHSNIPD
jgi:hypothetical protein